MLKHEFNLGEYILSEIQSAISSQVISAVIPAGKLSSIITTAINIVGGIPAAWARQEGIQQDFISFAENWELADYFWIFGLDAVLISDASNSSLHVHSWASPDSQNALNALNQVLHESNMVFDVMVGDYVSAHTEISWEYFTQNPNSALEYARELDRAQSLRLEHLIHGSGGRGD